eukprot:scaffold60584_cov53-Phaeocystis_antarctica.AAC.10
MPPSGSAAARGVPCRAETRRRRRSVSRSSVSCAGAEPAAAASVVRRAATPRKVACTRRAAARRRRKPACSRTAISATARRCAARCLSSYSRTLLSSSSATPSPSTVPSIANSSSRNRPSPDVYVCIWVWPSSRWAAIKHAIRPKRRVAALQRACTCTCLYVYAYAYAHVHVHSCVRPSAIAFLGTSHARAMASLRSAGDRTARSGGRRDAKRPWRDA